jgi:hypothetical protein
LISRSVGRFFVGDAVARAGRLGNAPLSSLDIPISSRAANLILRGGVSSLFALGSLSGRTYAQTVVCRRETKEQLREQE